MIKDYNDNSQEGTSLKDIINQLTNKVDNLLEENEKPRTEVSSLKKEISSLKTEISKNKNKHGKYKRIIKNMKSNFEEINTKSTKSDNELKLIQLRDSFKNIIDLFSKAFDISQDDSYINKLIMIKTKIKQQKNFDVVRKEELYICNFRTKMHIQ